MRPNKVETACPVVPYIMCRCLPDFSGHGNSISIIVIYRSRTSKLNMMGLNNDSLVYQTMTHLLINRLEQDS